MNTGDRRRVLRLRLRTCVVEVYVYSHACAGADSIATAKPKLIQAIIGVRDPWMVHIGKHTRVTIQTNNTRFLLLYAGFSNDSNYRSMLGVLFIRL